MKTYLLGFWEGVRSSFWFIPTLMAVIFAVLAFVTAAIDANRDMTLPGPFAWLDAGSPDAVRALLATIVGSIITVMSVVFSITIVSLTLAASQFGPRLLRNFMRDRANQFVLGTFIATFIYCLLVLHLVERSNEAHRTFVPHLSTMVALLLTLLSLGVLIFFIHHVAKMIQAPFVIDSVARSLAHAIDTFYPDPIDESPSDAATPEKPSDPAGAIPALSQGYVQAVDVAGLMAVARDCDVVLRMRYRPGAFIIRHATIADVWPRDAVDDHLCMQVNRCILIGKQRTDTQDIEYEIFQLVEVALRALSPSINDPFTAINCIDELGGALSMLAQRQFPATVRRDEAGTVRVVLCHTDYAGMVNAAFDQIRQVGRAHASVSIRLLETIARVMERARTPAQRRALYRQATMVHRGATAALPEAEDRRDVQQRLNIVEAALEG